MTPEHGPSPWLVVAAWMCLLACALGCREGYPSAGMDAVIDIDSGAPDTEPDAGPDATVDSRVADAPAADVGVGCIPAAESCNIRDDDCDETVDEDFDLLTDVSNCGGCGVVCSPPPFSTATCIAGSCGFSCNVGFEDCDGEPSNGCEASLSAAETCGTCGRACATPFALCEPVPTPMCVSSCRVGLTPCGASCVDTTADPSHCGACGDPCTGRANAAVNCASGTCRMTCVDGFGDCDGVEANGCERSLTSLAHCGGCGAPCSLTDAVASCATGTCEIVSCAIDRGDCDGMPATGCEAMAAHFWRDGDGDTWGRNTPPLIRCAAPFPVGYARRTGDCDDAEARVHPNATYQSTPAPAGGFDYNCDGRTEARWRDPVLCAVGPMCIFGSAGWETAVPVCGATGTWVSNCTGADPCVYLFAMRTQECR